ncbi:ice-binding family protein [Nonomuraea sp. NPDC026600]|uniref:ice-binding family protein n=1 Tax=Nonomuraea sp. NPDC026600 TaxID=3155363 RepID=UPI0033D1A83C
MTNIDFSRFWGNAGRLWMGVIAAVALVVGVLVTLTEGASAPRSVDIGAAEPYGVVAGVSVNNTNLTTISGDLGISPARTLTGFPPGTINGDRQLGNATAAAVKADVVAAYNDIAGRTADATVAAQLGGTTKGPGLYDSDGGGFAINGTLTLDAQGDPDAVFAFRADTLTTARVSNIALARGAQADNVFWQISDTAALGIYSTFRGNVLAQHAVAVNFGASVDGRIFSLNGSVTTTGTDSIPATRIAIPNDPPTATTLTSSRNPSMKGQPVTFTATVVAVSGKLIPAGEVVFKDGSTVLGSVFLNRTGRAVFTTSSLDRGQHRIVAVYLGGDTFDHEAQIHHAPSKSDPILQIVNG